jgi:hypothetical protein
MQVIKKVTPISAIKANLTKVKALRPKALDDLNDTAGIGSLVPRSRISFLTSLAIVTCISRVVCLCSVNSLTASISAIGECLMRVGPLSWWRSLADAEPPIWFAGPQRRR